MICTEAVFDIAWSGLRRFHAASDENGVYDITLYPASRRFRENVGRMDRVVIQYQTVRVGSPDDDTWRITVSESNARSGVRLLGIVGWARSDIVTAGAVGQRNWGKDVAALESHPLLPHHRCW